MRHSCDLNHVRCGGWFVAKLKPGASWRSVDAVMPLVRYTVMRMALFAATVVVLYIAGARSMILLVSALVISMLLSYIVLRSQRVAATTAIADRIETRRAATQAKRQQESDEDAESAN